MQMKKVAQWIAAALAIGVFAVASAGSEPAPAPAAPPASPVEITPVEVTPVTPATDEVVGLSAGLETETIYYSNASKTVIVGSCLQRTCHPKGRFCTGTTSAFRDIIRTPC
jgi:multidrug efflux pump subunit AcrA (membrane-fusion protein)